MAEMTDQDKLRALKDNIVTAAYYCIEQDFDPISRTILKIEVERLNVLLSDQQRANHGAPSSQ